MSIVWTFITAIPDLIRLLSALEKAAKAAETERKVSADLKALTGAVNAKDASAINHIFNS